MPPGWGRAPANAPIGGSAGRLEAEVAALAPAEEADECEVPPDVASAAAVEMDSAAAAAAEAPAALPSFNTPASE